jgi:hypothetical protein
MKEIYALLSFSAVAVKDLFCFLRISVDMHDENGVHELHFKGQHERNGAYISKVAFRNACCCCHKNKV